MKKTMTVLAAAMVLSSAVQAAGMDGVEGYAQGGFTDASGYDSEFALKLGADFKKNIGGVKNLGLTGFFTRWSGKASASAFGMTTSAKVSANAIAGGPTYDFPLQNTKFTLQGRAFLMYSMVKVETSSCFPASFGGGCSGGSASDSSLDLGFGIGGSFKLDNRMSIRVDYDMLDGADIFTAGVGYKF